jgi:hypothetical protein
MRNDKNKFTTLFPTARIEEIFIKTHAVTIRENHDEYRLKKKIP